MPAKTTLDVGDKMVSGIYNIPSKCDTILVFAHGAGAGMTHSFMETISSGLAERRIGTFRFNFPYMEEGRRGPNPQRVLVQAVTAAVEKVAGDYPQCHLFAGGKSMGGRMASHAAADWTIASVKGLVFFGFPLHAPGKDSLDRADHLHDLDLPMLFLQGTRDSLAKIDLIRKLKSQLGKKMHLHEFEGADHSFKTRKKDPRTTEETLEDLATVASAWMKNPV